MKLMLVNNRVNRPPCPYWTKLFQLAKAVVQILSKFKRSR